MSVPNGLDMLSNQQQQQQQNYSSHITNNVKPEPDKVMQDIADYVHSYKIDSDLAYQTAHHCFIDTIGCGLEGLRFNECSRLLGPVVDGTIVPNGVKVPGTPYQLDPIRAAFNVGTMIRWLDFNDCWLAGKISFILFNFSLFCFMLSFNGLFLNIIMH